MLPPTQAEAESPVTGDLLIAERFLDEHKIYFLSHVKVSLMVT